MNEIAYSWFYPRHDFKKLDDGTYILNRLHISPEEVTYKEETWLLEDGVFEEFEAFYEFLETTVTNDSNTH